MENEFKPNIYPIMYWALAFGATTGVLLFLVTLASSYIGIISFPIFLAGMIWGGYRNYKIQKARWHQQTGQPIQNQSPVEEFKQAVRDIAESSQEMMNQESQEKTEPTETEKPAEPEQPRQF
jgi:choline-glycine betaine transporter